MFVSCAQLEDLSEDDDVVPGIVLGPDPAVEPGEGPSRTGFPSSDGVH